MDLFALLRAGVRSGDTPDIGGSTDDRWRELYTAASSQGVSALVWDAIRRLPPELQPSRELRLRWAYNVERIERRYGQQRRRAAELAAAYAEAGIRTVVLKGRAVSRLYPVSEHRPCGDLDCFLCGDYERGNRVAEQVGAEVKRDFYKHSHIVFRGLTVENHRFCTAVRGSRRAKRFERYLQRLLAEGPLSCIPETALLVPPPDFNALFLAKHALSHFLTEGISLRHLCDWAVFIDREGDAVDWTAFRKVAAEDRLLRFAEILSDLSVRYLGVARNPLPAGMQALADLLRDALSRALLTTDDLYTDENLVVARLLSDPISAAYWRDYRRIRGTKSGKTRPENVYAVKVRAKKRSIDPLVQTKEGLKRFTAISTDYAARLAAFRADDFDRWVWASFE